VDVNEELSGWGDGVIDDAFLAKTMYLDYDKMVIVTVQCFGGGLMADPDGNAVDADADGVPHSGNMPADGDGTLGSSTYLN
jgi:hypothetical protein